MKPFAMLCASAAALVAMTAVVTAADLRPMPTKGPPVVAPVYNWSGFYVGIHGGYAWGDNAIELSGNDLLAPGFAAGIFPARLAGDPSGWLGGIQWGTNWQSGRFVFGFESDFSFASIGDEQTIVTPGTTPVRQFRNTGEQELTSFGTTRVRAGFTVLENLLLYGTGGLATGRAEVNVSHLGSDTGVLCAPVVICARGSESEWRWGWAVGAGVEYAIGKWSAKIEYLHYDLGTVAFTYFDPLFAAFVFTSRTSFEGDMVRFGLNYRFDWTPWSLLTGR